MFPITASHRPAISALSALGLLGGLQFGLLPMRMGVTCGESMRPTLAPGSVFLLDRTYYLTHPHRRGDVVVFHRGNDTCVKRIIATEGDTVLAWASCGSDGRRCELVRRWEVPHLGRLAHSRVFRVHYRVERLRIPAGQCFVVGDNRLVSEDSRNYGPISSAAIEGKVVAAPDAPFSRDTEYVVDQAPTAAPVPHARLFPASYSLIR